MADKTFLRLDGVSKGQWKDMGDGTHAEVVTLGEGGLPLPTGAATETTLGQLLAAVQAQIALAASVWTDDSGAFYVRRDSVDQGTGTIAIAFTDASGTAATPGAGLRPAAVDKEIKQTLFDVLTTGTGYADGDILARLAIIDVSTGTPSVTNLWLNITAGTTLAGAPSAGHIERADESIGARQIGAWTVALGSLGGAATEAKQDAVLAKMPAKDDPFTITGRTRDVSKDLVYAYADGTSETYYFTTAGDLQGKGARA